MAEDKRFLDGYVADSMYPSMFHHRFTPSWTDAFLVRHRIPSPRKPRGPFTFVDVGCGDGYGIVLNAVAHPEGRFFGFDMSAKHITRGNRLIRALKLGNVFLQHMKLANARVRVKADYIMSQGVLSWVDPHNRTALWKFASRTLKPGGVFTVGYNTLPGWSSLFPFQRLIRAFSEPLKGDSMARFREALELVRATGAIAADQLAQIDKELAGEWAEYLPHEYLNKFWSALWSGDVIASAAAHKLQFVHTATEHRLRNDFAFTKVQRDALRVIPTLPARETTADIFLNAGFRTDIFVKSGYRLVRADAADRVRLNQYWVAQCAMAEVKFSHQTAAGQLKFDNRAAHTILSRLERGPARLRDMPDVANADLLNTIDALFTAGLVRPVEAPCDIPIASAYNARVFDGMIAINALVGSVGSVTPVNGTGRLDAPQRLRLGLPSAKH